jgi:hypothetical protein
MESKVEYPIEFIRQAEETYTLAQLYKYGVPVAVFGRFKDNIKTKVVGCEILKIGNCLEYSKPVNASLVTKYVNIEEYGLSIDDNIIVCILPLSGEQAFALADLVGPYVNVIGNFNTLMAALDHISADDHTFVSAMHYMINGLKRVIELKNDLNNVVVKEFKANAAIYGSKKSKRDETADAKKALALQTKDIIDRAIIKSIVSKSEINQKTSVINYPIKLSGESLEEKISQWIKYIKFVGEIPKYNYENTELIIGIIKRFARMTSEPTCKNILTLQLVQDTIKCLFSNAKFAYAIFDSDVIMMLLQQDLSRMCPPNFIRNLYAMSLNHLVNEEINIITKGQEVGDNNKCLIRIQEMGHFYSTEYISRMSTKLKEYVGDYFNSLDLTKSFITGSAMACIMSKISDIETYYPIIYTVPKDWQKYRATLKRALEYSNSNCQCIVDLINDNTITITFNFNERVISDNDTKSKSAVNNTERKNAARIAEKKRAVDTHKIEDDIELYIKKLYRDYTNECNINNLPVKSYLAWKTENADTGLLPQMDTNNRLPVPLSSLNSRPLPIIGTNITISLPSTNTGLLPQIDLNTGLLSQIDTKTTTSSEIKDDKKSLKNKMSAEELNNKKYAIYCKNCRKTGTTELNKAEWLINYKYEEYVNNRKQLGLRVESKEAWIKMGSRNRGGKRRAQKSKTENKDNLSEQKSANIIPAETVVLEFEIKEGADVDIGVEVDNTEEFDIIAQKHFDTVRRYYNFAKIKKIDKAKGYYYQIYASGIHALTFRKIDIFMAKRTDVFTWHLYPVRAFYSVFKGHRDLFVTASCLYSLNISNNKDYFAYFKSKKQTPQEVILKYLQRGFYIQMPLEIKSGLIKYMIESDKWNNENIKIDRISDVISSLYSLDYTTGNFNLLNPQLKLPNGISFTKSFNLTKSDNYRVTEHKVSSM